MKEFRVDVPKKAKGNFWIAPFPSKEGESRMINIPLNCGIDSIIIRYEEDEES